MPREQPESRPQPESEFDEQRIVARTQGREGWRREARRQLEQHRWSHPDPVPRSRSERLLLAAARLEEELETERFANEQYEQARERRRQTRSAHRVGGPPKPYQPPEVPDGKVNLSDPDSKRLKAGITSRIETALADAQYWNEKHIDEVIANKHMQVLIPPDGSGSSNEPAGKAVATHGCDTYSRASPATSCTRKRKKVIEPTFGHTKHLRVRRLPRVILALARAGRQSRPARTWVSVVGARPLRRDARVAPRGAGQPAGARGSSVRLVADQR